MKTVLVALGCLLCGPMAPLPAQGVKIATVNTARVLEEFPPWQEEMQRQKEDREKFERNQRDNADRKTRYEEMIRQWEALKKQAADKALSKADRQKADKDAAALTKEIKELERLLPRRHGRDWGTPEQMFNEALARRRKPMRDELQKAVTTIAGREQCDFVFDVSVPAAGSSGVLWANPAKFLDLSPAVLTELKRRHEVKKLYTAVDSAEFFSIGAVGESGQPSPAETAFRELLTAPDAAERCRSLLGDGKPVGRLYGFLGLKLLHEKGDALYEARITKDKNTIRFMRGRTKSEHYVAEIAKQIAQGKLR